MSTDSGLPRPVTELEGGRSRTGSIARGVVGSIVRQATGRKARAVPSRLVRATGVTQDRNRLVRYAKVCGFPVRETVPATWIHVLTFPLHMELLSGPDAPFPLAGLVHVTNTMTLNRAVGVDEALTLTVQYGTPREHRRGVLIDLIGEAVVDHEPVWSGVSSYLVRKATLPDLAPQFVPGGVDLPSDFPDVPSETVWTLAGDLGRRYAAVSGDANPIHLSRVTARPFGFPRAIIHGMWTHARILAALENRLGAAYRMDIRFVKPILLPGTAHFGADPVGDGFDAVVRNASGQKVHAVARATPQG